MNTRRKVPLGLAFAAWFATLAAPVSAHPSVSVVRDSAGNVYYSDLEKVWRIAPDGTKSVAVPGVHTHELFVDAADNLFGEHLWYEGEASDRWGHRVWVRHPDGRVENVYAARTGFRTDYSFVRDAAGAHYWIDRGVPAAVRKKSADGREQLVVRLPPSISGDTIGWMTAAPDGTVYFTSEHELYRVAPDGAVRPLASALGATHTARPPVMGKHSLMGLWLDAQGNVYVAAWGAGVVQRVTPAGKVESFARSAWPWGPTGGLVAPNGDLWLLETSISNAVRVRKIPAAGGRDVVY